MAQEIIKTAADATMKAAVTGGISSSFMAYLNINAAAIGLMISFAGVCVATLFYWLNYKRNVANGVNEAHLSANHKRILELEETVRNISSRKIDGA